MGETKSIRKPSDVYKIGSETIEKKNIKLEITDDDRRIIMRILQQKN
jgi:hypothetical protein